MSQTNVEKWKQTPVRHEYEVPPPADVGELILAQRPALITPAAGILVDNTYYRAGITGSSPLVFARASVVSRLTELAGQLGTAGSGLLVLDAFRTTSTQASLFQKFFLEIRAANPSWSHEAVLVETRKFVAHPAEPSRFAVSPHNSGGAVDLTLHRQGTECAMGTAFDETSSLSETDYFEREYEPARGLTETQWHEIRENRRVLFHGMKSVGFVNYVHEWWHYDLGDCIWAETLGLQWVYGSLEREVLTETLSAVSPPEC